MNEERDVAMIEVNMTDRGVWLEITYAEGEPQTVWIPNKWLLPLMSGFRGRLDYLREAGIFIPKP